MPDVSETVVTNPQGLAALGFRLSAGRGSLRGVEPAGQKRLKQAQAKIVGLSISILGELRSR
jgi:hypothetical protein